MSRIAADVTQLLLIMTTTAQYAHACVILVVTLHHGLADRQNLELDLL